MTTYTVLQSPIEAPAADLASVASMAAASAPDAAAAANTLPLLPVLTVPPAEVPAGRFLIRWQRRSTKQSPVAEAERFRGVLVPEALLLLPAGAASSKFAALLQARIMELAAERLQSALEVNPLARQLPAAAFSLDAILAAWAEEKQRQQISAATIVDWLPQTKTWLALTEAQQKGWLARIPKLAAPGFRAVLTKEQAAIVLARMDEGDLDSLVGEFLASRLNSIINAEDVADAL